MNCQEFQNELDRCVEQRIAPGADLEAHSQECSASACLERWEEHQLLTSAITAWRAELPSIDIADVVLQGQLQIEDIPVDQVEVLGPVPGKGKWSEEPHWAGAVVASVALLVAACLLIALSIQPILNSSNQVVEDSGPETKTFARSVSPEEEQHLRELGQSYASFMNTASDKVTQTVTMVIPDQDAMSADGMGSTSQWLDTWSERLEPLETKFDETVRNFVDETISEMNDLTS